MTTRSIVFLGFRLLFPVVLLFLLCGAIVWGVASTRQQEIVQELLRWANTHYKGEISVKGCHLSPFAQFPYVSVDLEDVLIYEDKQHRYLPVVQVKDLYLGFDFWGMLTGNYDVKQIRLNQGVMRIVQHTDSSFNLLNALLPEKQSTDTTSQPFAIHLRAIRLEQLDIHKYNELTQTDIDLFIYRALADLQLNEKNISGGLTADFMLNVMQDGDTTFIRKKHVQLNARMRYDTMQRRLTVLPSQVKLEKALFKAEGVVDMMQQQYVDFNIHGAKDNFDLLIAFAPEELIPSLRTYDNKGKIFFDARIKGETANDKIPAIDVRFGCSGGIIKNPSTQKTLDEMSFTGYFTTGAERKVSSMEFGLQQFSARPEAGTFSGKLRVRNFNEPDILLQLNAAFNLDFISRFFNLQTLEDLSGKVALEMNFHDIIDLQHPEKSIEKLNESYYTRLNITDLRFKSKGFHLPVEQLNVNAEMDGHRANIRSFRAKVGATQFTLSGTISDLPAILHHSAQPVEAQLKLESPLLHLEELTYSDSLKKSLWQEQIRGFLLDVSFVTSAKAVTESPNLPVGEFFIRQLRGRLKQYPHAINDAKADIFIENESLRIKDFFVTLDQSDIHFSGQATRYDLLWRNEQAGTMMTAFELKSRQIQLADLFVYGGENGVPPEYRHESIQQLHLYGKANIAVQQKAIQRVDMFLEKLSGSLQQHRCRLEQFHGRLGYSQQQQLNISGLKGQIGRSDLTIDLQWFLGKDSIRQRRENILRIQSNRLDVDQLLTYNPAATDKAAKPQDHENVFNVFSLSFPNMQLQAKVGTLYVHNRQLNNLSAGLRIQSDHYVMADSCRFETAGGTFDLAGYFNGSNPSAIYFNPRLSVRNVDIDQLGLVFEQGGKDALLADHLHGKLSGRMTGKLRVHADLTPILDASDLTVQAEITGGRMENYKPMMNLATYFADKNLARIRFDTLRNEFVFRQNKLTIPRMTINSSLGYLEWWGEQDLKTGMDYYFRIPMKLITQVAFQQLFKRKREEVDLTQEDAIQYQDSSKTELYAQINVSGSNEDMRIRLKRDKRKK